MGPLCERLLATDRCEVLATPLFLNREHPLSDQLRTCRLPRGHLVDASVMLHWVPNPRLADFLLGFWNSRLAGYLLTRWMLPPSCTWLTAASVERLPFPIDDPGAVLSAAGEEDADGLVMILDDIVADHLHDAARGPPRCAPRVAPRRGAAQRPRSCVRPTERTSAQHRSRTRRCACGSGSTPAASGQRPPVAAVVRLARQLERLRATLGARIAAYYRTTRRRSADRRRCWGQGSRPPRSVRSRS